MICVLADENFNGDIVRGLKLRWPDLEVLRVQDVGLAGVDDPAVLRWAAENDRIVLTHDRATMPEFAYQRMTTGQPMPGVFVFNDRFPSDGRSKNCSSSQNAPSTTNGAGGLSICRCDA